MNSFVGNLSFQTTDVQLRCIAEQFAEVRRCEVIKDHATGQSREFAFLEIADASAANMLMIQLNSQTVDGRKVNASEARPKPLRSALAHSVEENEAILGSQKPVSTMRKR